MRYIQTQNEESPIFTNGDLKIDYSSGCVWLQDRELHLTPSEYKLLCLLAHNVGKVMTHTAILKAIWGSTLDSDVASLRVFMTTLRKSWKAALPLYPISRRMSEWDIACCGLRSRMMTRLCRRISRIDREGRLDFTGAVIKKYDG